VFEVAKFRPSTGETVTNFAYTMMPLTETFLNNTYLAPGQFQLPLIEGAPPQELFNHRYPPKKVVGRQKNVIVSGM